MKCQHALVNIDESALSASLHADDEDEPGRPGRQLARLEVVSVRGIGSVPLRPLSPLALDPSTVYHLVVTWEKGHVTVRRNLPSGGGRLPGWGLEGASQSRTSSIGPWSAAAGGQAFLFRLYGQAASGPPSAPRELTAEAGSDRVRLAWQAPLVDGGAAPAEYVVEVSGDGTDWRELPERPTGTSHTHTGLYPGAERHYRVYAVNLRGPSPASGTVTARTVPGAVVDPERLVDNLLLSGALVENTSTNSFLTRRSVSFTTGPGGAGYLLDHLLIAVLDGELPGAAIHDDDGGEPAGDPRYVLDRSTAAPEPVLLSGGIAAGNGQRFDAPEGAFLHPSTRYHLVFDYPVGVKVFFGTGLRERGLAGWRVAGRVQEFRSNTREWTAGADAGAPLVVLRGAEDAIGPGVLASNELSPPADEAVALGAGGPARAQGFTTGSEAVPLDWVALELESGAPADLAVELYTAGSDGLPAARLARLQAATASGTGRAVFAAPAGTALEAETTYFVVVRAEGGAAELGATEADGQFARSGWALADGYLTQIGRTGNSWSPVPSSRSLLLTIAGVPPGLPAAPAGLTASARPGARVELTWCQPSGPGGLRAHRIEWSADGREPWSLLHTDVLPADTGNGDTGDCNGDGAADTGHRYTDRGPVAGETRHYRVYAINDGGLSRSPSSPATATAFSARHLVSNLAKPTVEDRWLRVGGAGETHGYAAQSFRTGTNAEGYALSGVALVLAQQEAGAVEVALHQEQGGQPGPLLHRLAAPAGTADGTVEFAAPEEADLTAETTYHVVVHGLSGAHTLRTTASDAEDAGRAPGWSIGPALRVSAPGETARWGGPENSGLALAIRVQGVPRSAPAAPTGLRALARGAHRIDLRWDEPSYGEDGGAPVTGYRVEVSENIEAAEPLWTTLEADTGDGATGYRHTGLLRDSTRSYRVRASNSLGESPPSAPATATTGEFGAPGATAPGAESTLLSNLDLAPDVNLKFYVSTKQERDDNAAHGEEWSRLSQAFSTGPLAAGLSAVRLDQVAIGPDEALALWVYSDILGQPGVRLHRLDGPIPGPGKTKVFHARPGVVLEKETAYHLVVDHAGGLLGIGSTRDPDQVGRAGWEIAGHSVLRGPTHGLTNPQERPALRFSLSGYELPARPRVALTATAESPSVIALGWTVDQRAFLPATGFRIEVSGDGESWQVLEPGDGATEAEPAREYRHQGLRPGSTRHYRVTALTALGPGDPSEPAVATTGSATLLSNLGRPRGAGLAPDPAVYDAYSQPFTTGPAAGASLESVELDFRSAGAADGVVLWLHRDQDGRPGASVDRFIEAEPVRAGRNRFVLPRSARLRPQTTYHLVLLFPGGGFELATAGDGMEHGEARDDGAAPGWSLGDQVLAQERSSSRWRPLEAGPEARAIAAGLRGHHPLSAPRELEAQLTGADTASLIWEEGRFTAGLSGYRVEVYETGAGWQVLAELDGPELRGYQHGPLPPGVTSVYRVRAVSAGGVSEPTAAASVRTPGTGQARVLLSNEHLYATQGYSTRELDFPEFEFDRAQVTRVAQGFTTGPNPLGYRLTGIQVFAREHNLGSDPNSWWLGVKEAPDGPLEYFTREIDDTPGAFTTDESEALAFFGDPLAPEPLDVGNIPAPVRGAGGAVRIPVSNDEGEELPTLKPNTTYYLIVDVGFGTSRYEGKWEVVSALDEHRFPAPGGWSFLETGPTWLTLWDNSLLEPEYRWAVNNADAEEPGSLKLRLEGYPVGPPPEAPSGLLAYELEPGSRTELGWSGTREAAAGEVTGYLVQGAADCDAEDDGWEKPAVAAAEVEGASARPRRTVSGPPEGCYRVSAITGEGLSPPSLPESPARPGQEAHPWLLTGNYAQPAAAAARPSGGQLAQRFRTGPHGEGYALRGLVLRLDRVAAEGGLVVRLHADDGGRPGRELAELTGPENLEKGAQLFTPWHALRLQPSTGYHVVVSGPSGLRLGAVAGGGQDPGGEEGFALADSRLARAAGSSAWRAGGPALRLELAGVALGPPGPPEDLRADPDSRTSVLLRWAEPDDHGRTAVSGYRIERSGDGATWRLLGEAGPAATSYPDGGAQPGRRYFYRVYALGPAGPSEPSLASTALAPLEVESEALLSSLDSAESASRILQVAEIHLAQHFTTGSNPGGYAVESLVIYMNRYLRGYLERLEIREHPRVIPSFLSEIGTVMQFETVEQPGIDGFPATGPGPIAFLAGDSPALLKPETEYYLVIQPSHRNNPAFRVTGEAFSAIDDDGAWQLHDEYHIWQSGDFDPASADGDQCRDEILWCPNDDEHLAMELRGAPLDLPGAPVGLEADVTDDDRVRLSWSPAANEGPLPVTGYELARTRTPENEDSWESLEIGDNRRDRTSHVDSTYEDGVNYYRVRALTRVGHSAWSPVLRVGASPSPPQNLTASFDEDGPGTVKLMWEPGAAGAGGPTKEYVIETSMADQGWVEVDRLTVEECVRDETGQERCEFTHTGLEAGDQPRYRVFAVNGAGRSEPSAVVSAAATAPAPPTGLSAVAVPGDPTTVELKWTPPGDDGGSPLTGYQVEYSKEMGAGWLPLVDIEPECEPGGTGTPPADDAECETKTLGTSHRHEVPEGAAYDYRVRAVNAAGRSEPSRAASPSLLNELQEAPFRLLLDTSMGVGLGQVSDGDGNAQDVRGYRAGGNGPALGSLDRRDFAYAGQRYLVAALTLIRPQDDGGGGGEGGEGRKARVLELRLEPAVPAGEAPPLGRLWLTLGEVEGEGDQKFRLGRADREDLRNEHGRVTASVYRWEEKDWPAGVLDLELEQGVPAAVRLYGPLLARPRADSVVQADIEPDGVWNSFQVTGERVAGVDASGSAPGWTWTGATASSSPWTPPASRKERSRTSCTPCCPT